MKYNKNCLLVLRCNDERNLLDVEVQEVEDIYGIYLDKYKAEFARSENHVYTIEDFENIIHLFNELDTNILLINTKNFPKKHLERLDKEETNYFVFFDYLKDYINLVNANLEVPRVEIFNKICLDINADYNSKLDFSQYIKGFIEYCYYALERLCKISNFDCQYEKNKNDSNILYTSHRKKGFQKETPIEIEDNLTISIHTNFGYEKSSYLFVSMKYKNVDIIPTYLFNTTIPPKNKKKQIYIKDFKVDDKEWLNVLTFIKDILNLIISNKAQFINEYIIKDFNERLSFCENLIDNETIVINELRKYEKNRNLDIERLLFKSYKISHLYSIYNTFIKDDKNVITEDWEIRVEKLIEKIRTKLKIGLEIANDELIEKKNSKEIVENNQQSFFYSFITSYLESDLKKIAEYIEEFDKQ